MTIDGVKTFPNGWRDAMARLTTVRAETHSPVTVERIDASTLAARIGVHPKAEPSDDGRAPWRRALRTPQN